MSVDLSNLRQHVTVAVGERVVIPLPSYANSGNSWSAICVCGHGIADVFVKLGNSPAIADSQGDDTAEPPPLMVVPEQAVVSGLTSGEAVWQLTLSRSFGPAQVTASHDLMVTVTAIS